MLILRSYNKILCLRKEDINFMEFRYDHNNHQCQIIARTKRGEYNITLTYKNEDNEFENKIVEWLSSNSHKTLILKSE